MPGLCDRWLFDGLELEQWRTCWRQGCMDTVWKALEEKGWRVWKWIEFQHWISPTLFSSEDIKNNQRVQISYVEIVMATHLRVRKASIWELHNTVFRLFIRGLGDCLGRMRGAAANTITASVSLSSLPTPPAHQPWVSHRWALHDRTWPSFKEEGSVSHSCLDSGLICKCLESWEAPQVVDTPRASERLQELEGRGPRECPHLLLGSSGVVNSEQWLCHSGPLI